MTKLVKNILLIPVIRHLIVGDIKIWSVIFGVSLWFIMILDYFIDFFDLFNILWNKQKLLLKTFLPLLS